MSKELSYFDSVLIAMAKKNGIPKDQWDNYIEVVIGDAKKRADFVYSPSNATFSHYSHDNLIYEVAASMKKTIRGRLTLTMAGKELFAVPTPFKYEGERPCRRVKLEDLYRFPAKNPEIEARRVKLCEQLDRAVEQEQRRLDRWCQASEEE